MYGHAPDTVAQMPWATVQRIVALHQLHNPLQ
jgi:hypothetical protein